MPYDWHLVPTAELDGLRAKIVSAYMETDFLRWSWEEEYPNVYWEVPVNADIEGAASEPSLLPFTSVPHFSHFERAVDAIYFNVIRLLLCELAVDVGLLRDALLRTSGTYATLGPFSNAMLPPGQGGLQDFALEICRTVQYLVHGETNSPGSLVLMFPLRVASHHLQNHPHVV